MSVKPNESIPSLLPKQLKGVIFTEVFIPLIRPEIDPRDLIRLGAIVRKKNRVESYIPLTDSLRKIQMVKLAGFRAKQIENQIAREIVPDSILQDPVGQIEHALNVTNFIVHTKSALDSMAVFLTGSLNLRASGGDRDFKKPQFRQAINDVVLGPYITGLAGWFDSLQTIRDEWIHRGFVRNPIVIGKSVVGRLPIPRDVTLGSKAWSLPLSKDNLVSTSEFVDFHYSRLANLFTTIVKRSIELESSDLTEPVPEPAEAESQMSMFQTIVTENMKVTKVRVGTMTASLQLRSS